MQVIISQSADREDGWLDEGVGDRVLGELSQVCSSNVSSLPELQENCIEGIIRQGRGVPCQMVVNLEKELSNAMQPFPFGYSGTPSIDEPAGTCVCVLASTAS